MSDHIDVVFFDIGDTLVHEAQWVPGALDLLETLRGRVRVGLLSNTGNATREELKGLLPPDFSFDDFEPALVILSSEVGMDKRDPEIFRLAAAGAGVPPAKCLYCSESAREVLVAQRAEMLAARIAAGGAPFASDIGELVSNLTAAGLLAPERP